MNKITHKTPRGTLKSRRSFINKSIIILLSVFFIFFVLMVPFFPHIMIIHGESQNIVLQKSIRSGENFSIKFTHSIHLTPVQETYSIDKNLNIVLSQLSFDTYGVGIPSDLQDGEKIELKNGKIIIKNMNRIFPYINLRVGQVIADHRLLFENESVILSEVVKPGSFIQIRAKKISALQLLIHELASN